MPDQDRKTTRRTVLAGGLAAPVAAGAALTGAQEAEARVIDEGGSPLMRDTEHTRAYLASARF